MKLGRKSPPPPTGAPAARRRLQEGYQAERPQAFSYYARRANNEANTGRTEIENPRPTPKADLGDLKLRLMAIGAVLGILVLVILLSALTGQPKVALVKNGDSAYFLQPASTYAGTAEKTLAGSVLNRNKLTVDTEKISQELTKSYPEVKNATVVLPAIGTSPTVYIEPYRPSFIITSANSTAYLLDEYGRALVSVSQITDSGELATPAIEDKSGIVVKLGDQVLPRATVMFIEEVLRILATRDINQSNIVLPAESSEVDVYITGKPYFVKFNLRGDARQQAGTFVATKARMEKDGTVPGQYVDVRVPERAYIR
jgi:hypothetical protein